jgi:hypothetical protein
LLLPVGGERAAAVDPVTRTFTPVADAHVRSDRSGSSLGTSRVLQVDNSPVRRGYLRFDLSSLPSGATVTGASLRLYISHDCSEAAPGRQVRTLPSTTWQERTITWANAPRNFSAPRASSGSWAACGWTQATLPAGSLPAAAPTSYAVTTPSANHKELHAREGANDPQLVVTCLPPAPPTPALSIGELQVTEGGSGTADAIFTVSLSPPSQSTVTVSWATDNGSAAAPFDYTASGGSLTFAPDETARTVAVPVVGDALVEPDETFTVALSDPVNAAVAWLATSPGGGRTSAT